MSARIIDGKALAARTREKIAEDVKQLQQHKVTPGLTVVLVGDDAASQVYVRNKAAACEKAGINSEIIRLPANANEDRLLDTVRALNQNPDVHGILEIGRASCRERVYITDVAGRVPRKSTT